MRFKNYDDVTKLWDGYKNNAYQYNSDHTQSLQSTISGNRRRTLWTSDSWMESVIPTPRVSQSNTGAISSGRQHASRPGGTHGRDIRITCGTKSGFRSTFNRDIPSGGYAWWYIDTISEDRNFGITIIALIGNVFSPYYYRARKRSRDITPENFSAFNVAIYNNKSKAWCLTERGHNSIKREADYLKIGPSSVTWNGNYLEFNINEYTVPIPKNIKGSIRVYPAYINNEIFSLDQNENHKWWPAAPRASVEVTMSNPSLNWKGHGYFDANWGNEPLENRFEGWNWSCAKLNNGERAINYNTNNINEQDRKLFLHFNKDGKITRLPPPSVSCLDNTRVWQMPREMSAENSNVTKVIKTLEDTPFYSRSIVSSNLCGQPVSAMHESLDLVRFKKTSTQMMLPFRLPRNTFSYNY